MYNTVYIENRIILKSFKNILQLSKLNYISCKHASLLPFVER